MMAINPGYLDRPRSAQACAVRAGDVPAASLVSQFVFQLFDQFLEVEWRLAMKFGRGSFSLPQERPPKRDSANVTGCQAPLMTIFHGPFGRGQSIVFGFFAGKVQGLALCFQKDFVVRSE